MDYVNPFIGTDKAGVPPQWGMYGGTYPGAVVPYGMVQMTPETRTTGKPQGYFYSDSTIAWFSLVNHASGYPAGSTGDIRIMVAPDSHEATGSSPGVPFRHNNEVARPGYYSVLLDNGIRAEVTATQRAGFGRFTMKGRRQAVVQLTMVRDIAVVGQTRITGSGRMHAFVMDFNMPFTRAEKSGRGVTLYYDFPDSAAARLLVKVGVSSTGIDGAAKNLEAEIPGWDFEATQTDARRLWNAQLRTIEVEGGTETDRILFYTALYHASLQPHVFSDRDGSYRGFDRVLRTTGGRDFYSQFSPWDTFRCLHPLVTIIQPKRQSDMIFSLLERYRQSRSLPTGPMSGYHGIPMIVDSYFKGIRGFDTGIAYEAVRKSVLEPPYEYPDMEEYARTGYVPAEEPESVTRTLEYAYDDWVAGQFARALGKDNDAGVLMKRAFNYRNVYNPASRFMESRFRSGAWCGVGGYEEGDPWSYTWFVPHNVQDLVNQMGGPEAFSAKLDEAFSSGSYLHDNEPPLHYAYLFDYAGKPWKTQQWVRHILATKYSNTPGGIPGNDDLGTMSSWYVFSAMGFYPVCPGRPSYEIGSPVFDRITIHLEKGKTFVIIARAGSPRNIYVQSATLNGRPLSAAWFTHAALAAGGELRMNMGPDPNTHWASGETSVPPSLTKGAPRFAVGDPMLSAETLKADQPLRISVPVTNRGVAGSCGLTLALDDTVTQSAWLRVDSGATATAVMTVRLYEPGRHTIRVNALPPKTVTLAADPAGTEPAFAFSGLQVTPLVRTGESLSATASVRNIRSFASPVMARLLVDGAVVDSQRVEFRPGEKKDVRFLYAARPGFHTVGINSLTPQKMKVYAGALESLVLHLTFDEGKDSLVADHSGFDNHGIVKGDVLWVEGKSGPGIRTSESAFVEVPDAPSTNVCGKALTMMVWFCPSDDGHPYADFFTKGDHNVLKLQSSRMLNFIAGGWGRGECLGLVPQEWDRHWHHVAGVCDGSMLKLYVDGELIQSCAIEGDIGPTPFPWNVGRNAQVVRDRRTKGALDEVRVYGDALSQEEIKTAMKANGN